MVMKEQGEKKKGKDKKRNDVITIHNIFKIGNGTVIKMFINYLYSLPKSKEDNNLRHFLSKGLRPNIRTFAHKSFFLLFSSIFFSFAAFTFFFNFLYIWL